MAILRPSGSLVPAVLILLSGCNGCKEDDLLPTLLEADDATPVGVWVGEGLGASPVSVPVYATSALGAVVPAGAISLTSDATVDGALIAGADGWGVASVSAPDRGRFTLTATLDAATADGAASVVEGGPGVLDSTATATGAEPSQIARAAGGVAWSVGGEVWWSGWDGAPAARVLALDEPVVSLFSAEIDADGVTDVIVTSASRVVLLRGRDGGGLVWGAGWTAAEGRTVAGAVVTDRGGDALADVTLALNDADGAGSWLYQLDGDGLWGFTAADSLHLDYPVFGVSVEDLDNNGVSEVTVLSADGLLRRYTRADDSWVATLTGSQYTLEIGEGGRLFPSTDLTGDGVPELIAVGPSLDGTSWMAWVITAGAASPAQYPIVTKADYAWLGLALGDLSGDGVVDLAFTTEGRIVWALWNADADNFVLTGRRDVPSGSTLALDDIDDDGVMDAIIGGTSLRVLHGDRDPDDLEDPTDTVSEWIVRTPAPVVFGVHLVAEPVVADINGDAVVDVVGLVLPSGGAAGVALQGFYGAPETDTVAETLRSGGSVTLSGSGTAIDFAVCGTRAYALYEEADDTGVMGTWLARADLGAGLGPTLDGEPLAVDGTLLACGAFAEGEVAVVGVTGAVTYVDAAGALTAGESIGAVGGVVAIDGDGDGTDAVYPCAEAGCVVVAGDLDDDGAVDLAVQDSAGVTVTMGGEIYVIDSLGGMRIGDADGDTVPDLLFGEYGAAYVVRGLPGGLTPPVARFVLRPTEDAVQYGDLDGDGLPDAFFAGVDRDASDGDATWVGTLIYARATE